jgi:uncharacterized membrane protein YhiD involved in acid resistance
MRDGLTVRGLNTAATLWCSAAVGALAGAALYAIAVAGTAVVVGVTWCFVRSAGSSTAVPKRATRLWRGTSSRR